MNVAFLSLQSIARALGGDIVDGQVLAPGPRHSIKDRSLSFKIEPGSRDGFVVNSFSNDDPIECKDYVRSKLGLPGFEPKASSPQGTRRTIFAIYDYIDEHGVLLKQAVRYDPKDFRQRHPDPDKPGSWLWKVAGTRNVPYRLPLLLSSTEAPVFIVEGEKDADKLVRLGLVATTNIAGAGKWTADLNLHFKGRTVFVLPDNDEAGADHARLVARHLAPVAAEVRIVALPGLPLKGDVSDWLASGNDPSTMLDLCKTFPVVDPHEAKRKPTFRLENDDRPVIPIRAGQIREAVDSAEAALIARGGLYQRANQIVFLGEAPVITHDAREVTASRIFERGENALAEDIAEVACIMKYDARAEDDVVIDPPSRLIKTLKDRVGRFKFPVLTAIINAPTLRPDGSLLASPGYDRKTGLYLDPRGVEFPPIAAAPSRGDAERALALLSDLLAGFPFEDEPSRAVALSAILTATVRQGIRSAPMHAFSAPVAGSGKSKLVDIASAIATGREAGVMAQAADEAEMEKRLGALYLQGAGMVAIDNCGFPVDGNFLCAALTQATVSIRPLGTSTQVEVPTTTFLTATGNNLVIAGDMTRRAVVARLDPRVERPELRSFDFEPVEKAKAGRVGYVVAALTVLLAYKAAGSPAQAAPLGSFEGWSRRVRDALLWLGCADPVITMEQARETDPKLHELTEVMTQWRAEFGSDKVAVRQVIEKAAKQEINNFGGRGDFTSPDLRESLLAVAGQGGAINGKRLGKWLLGNAKRIVAGYSIKQVGHYQGTVVWQIVQERGTL